MSTEEELTQKKRMSLLALQELLADAKTHRPSRSDEISKIEEALSHVEDRKEYIEKFDDLEELVDNLLTSTINELSNLPNNDWLNRLKEIKEAINNYKNAYANYAAHLGPE